MPGLFQQQRWVSEDLITCWLQMSTLTLFISPVLDAPRTVVMQPTTNQPPTLHLHPHHSFAFYLHTELGFKTCSTRTHKVFSSFLWLQNTHHVFRAKGMARILSERKEIANVSTFFRMPVSLSVSQSMIICPSFLLSRSWNTFRKEASVMVSTFTEVTSQSLSAAVSRTFCSTDRPVHVGGRQGRELRVEKVGKNRVGNYALHMILRRTKWWLSRW